MRMGLYDSTTVLGGGLEGIQMLQALALLHAILCYRKRLPAKACRKTI